MRMDSRSSADNGVPDDLVRKLAAHLAVGHQTGEAVAILDEFAEIDVEDAYRVQERVTGHLVEFQGERAIGWKISCTGEDDRARINATEPFVGVLFESSFLPDRATLPLANANGPLAEPELVLRITREVSHDSTLEDLAASVEVAAGLELPHARFAGWWPEGQPPNLTKETLVADNAVAGRVVVSDEWRTMSVEEISAITCTLTLPDGTVREGSATAVYGSPLKSLSWLLGKLDTWGRDLPVGSMVSSGTFTTPARVEPGRYSVRFSAVGRVEANFIRGETG